MNWPIAFILSLNILFRFAVLGVTAYAVFFLDRSGWWFLLAVILCSGSSEVEWKNEAKR